MVCQGRKIQNNFVVLDFNFFCLCTNKRFSNNNYHKNCSFIGTILYRHKSGQPRFDNTVIVGVRVFICLQEQPKEIMNGLVKYVAKQYFIKICTYKYIKHLK
jgi:hypothetical protein